MSIVRLGLASTIAAAALISGPAAAAQATTPAAGSVRSDDLVGTWVPIDTRTGATRPGNPSLTITSDGEIRGEDGCDSYWGHRTVDRAAGTVTFHIDETTLLYCLIAPVLDVSKEIEGTHDYRVYGNRLTLTNARGTRTVFVRR